MCRYLGDLPGQVDRHHPSCLDALSLAEELLRLAEEATSKAARYVSDAERFHDERMRTQSELVAARLHADRWAGTWLAPQFHEPGSEATAPAAQMTAMGVTVLESIARLRLTRGQEFAAEHARAASAARQQRHAGHSAARLALTPAFRRLAPPPQHR